MTPLAFRRNVREGKFSGPTAGQCDVFVQANLAIIPEAHAIAFRHFCEQNAKACPLLAVGNPGEWTLPTLGEDIDIRQDLTGYWIYRNGEKAAVAHQLQDLWRDDLVVFALGCSFSFEYLLLREGLPVRHVELGGSAPVYVTNLPNLPAGPFAGNLAVSMRPFKPADAIRAIELTSRYPQVHGAPVHFGDPTAIGIGDLGKPDFPGIADVHPGEVPLFWACGLTPQVALFDAKLDFAIGHAPGHMLVTDLRLDQLDPSKVPPV
ncbi:putative hydro-lyase [Paraburkholderia flagellata]|uniref:putative hydro-lyase n=1 Tax=Paraburkholderia flagellata TaxID=2883241 RepID=UPI001F45A6F8|nr:putative hydro-lyase [Paraburkholderia flagellata]